MARASAPTSTRSWCRPCTPATSSSPTTSGPTRSPGPPSGTCHPTARTSIPSSSASRSSRPSFAPLAVAAPRRSGRSSASAWRTSALTHAATIFGTAGTRPPHGHEKRFSAWRKRVRRGRGAIGKRQPVAVRASRLERSDHSRTSPKPVRWWSRRVAAWDTQILSRPSGIPRSTENSWIATDPCMCCSLA